MPYVRAGFFVLPEGTVSAKMQIVLMIGRGCDL